MLFFFKQKTAYEITLGDWSSDVCSYDLVGEFLVATQGVGHYIEHSRQVADTVGVFAGIVIAMVLVLSINAVVNVVERRALGWRPVERDMEL